MKEDSPFTVFARYGGKAHAVAERKKRHRGQKDAFLEGEPEIAGDERYTTRETMAWCLERAGVDGFDLDVAACEESHHAPRWYSKVDNGLLQPWFGRVWCNPPYSDIEPWAKRAWEQLTSCAVIAMLVPATRTEQPWWHSHIEPRRDRDEQLRSFFLPGRTEFARPGSGGVAQSGSPFGCVLLVWRNA